MNALSGFLLVFRHSFLRLLRGKRLFVLLLLAAIPAIISALISSHAKTVGMEDYLSTVLILVLQATVPFGALSLGIAVLGDEIDGRTITFLYTRPLPRPVFFLGRLFGFVGAFGVLLALSVFLTAFFFREHVELSGREVGGTVAIAVGGLLVYAAFFAMLRAYFKKALYIGFLLTFAFEITISKMPVAGISKISIWHQLALLVARLHGDRARGHDLLGTVKPEETAGDALLILACVLVASLVLGCWAVKAREVRVPAAVA
jgi:ABC-type transport system involved in multi-copper enzyme maturation permease subunit